MSNPLKKIVVVGSDACAWVSALVLHAHLKHSKLPIDLELVETPSDLSNHDVYTLLPTQRALMDLMGISETTLLRMGGAQISMAQRYTNWSGPGPAYIHAYDRYGVPFNSVSFLQYWLAAQKEGLNVPLEDFCLGAVAAKQGRVAASGSDNSRFSRATYGYHFSSQGFVKTVAETAVRSGLKCRNAKVDAVNTEMGRITSILLSSGELITADLFIDATGSSAVLSHALNPEGFQSWESLFLCDSQIVTSGPALSPMPAFSEVLAIREGWAGLYPIGKKTGVRIEFASDQSDPQSVIDNVMSVTGLAFESAVHSKLARGHRAEAWQGNCISVGRANASLDGLDAVDLSVLQLGLSYLLMLMPGDSDFQAEADVYNSKLNSHIARLRDYQLLHYKLNQRQNEPFWDRAREIVVPSSLSEKIDLFSVIGKVDLHEDEMFQEESWVAGFIGHGLRPEHHTPLVDSVAKDVQVQIFQDILKTIATEVNDLPTLDFYMQMC